MIDYAISCNCGFSRSCFPTLRASRKEAQEHLVTAKMVGGICTAVYIDQSSDYELTGKHYIVKK